jgi:peptidoglycan/xylan/chitin deacetylase (PgdA/CDA1 family)
MSGTSKNNFGEALDSLKNNNIATITVSQHTASTITPRAAITFDDGLTAFYDNAYPLLKERGIKSTVFPVAALVGKTGSWDVMGQTCHMTAAMLREIADDGHEVGSHSLTHANLVWLDDRGLIRELSDSKAMLEDITGAAVKSLSFPFGSWDRRVWDAAKSVGYEYATAYRGHRRAPPEMLPVFGVYRFDSADDIVKRAASAASPPPQPPTSQPTTQPLSLPPLSDAASKAIALIMPHFSKGTPIVKFRRDYRLLPRRAPQDPTCGARSRS